MIEIGGKTFFKAEDDYETEVLINMDSVTDFHHMKNISGQPFKEEFRVRYVVCTGCWATVTDTELINILKRNLKER